MVRVLVFVASPSGLMFELFWVQTIHWAAPVGKIGVLSDSCEVSDFYGSRVCPTGIETRNSPALELGGFPAYC